MKNIKVIVKKGKREGLNVVVIAGVHGDEYFGVKMLEDFIPKFRIESGKVTFIIANLEAIKQNKRFIEYNLNRAFFDSQPTEISETLEGKTAREIIPYLKEADIMLDIHASFTEDSVPFIICQPQSFEFAKCLPFEIVSWNWDKFEPGSTDYYMNLQNKVGICIECGFMLDKTAVEMGRIALNNFLVKAGSIKGNLIGLKNQKFFKIIDLYWNKFGPFKKFRDFPDFYKTKEKTLVGFDGTEKVFVDKGNYLLFVRDRPDKNDECFLVAKETLLNKIKLNGIERR